MGNEVAECFNSIQRFFNQIQKDEAIYHLFFNINICEENINKDFFIKNIDLLQKDLTVLLVQLRRKYENDADDTEKQTAPISSAGNMTTLNSSLSSQIKTKIPNVQQQQLTETRLENCSAASPSVNISMQNIGSSASFSEDNSAIGKQKLQSIPVASYRSNNSSVNCQNDSSKRLNFEPAIISLHSITPSACLAGDSSIAMSNLCRNKYSVGSNESFSHPVSKNISSNFANFANNIATSSLSCHTSGSSTISCHSNVNTDTISTFTSPTLAQAVFDMDKLSLIKAESTKNKSLKTDVASMTTNQHNICNVQCRASNPNGSNEDNSETQLTESDNNVSKHRSSPPVCSVVLQESMFIGNLCSDIPSYTNTSIALSTSLAKSNIGSPSTSGNVCLSTSNKLVMGEVLIVSPDASISYSSSVKQDPINALMCKEICTELNIAKTIDQKILPTSFQQSTLSLSIPSSTEVGTFSAVSNSISPKTKQIFLKSASPIAEAFSKSLNTLGSSMSSEVYTKLSPNSSLTFTKHISTESFNEANIDNQIQCSMIKPEIVQLPSCSQQSQQLTLAPPAATSNLQKITKDVSIHDQSIQHMQCLIDKSVYIQNDNGTQGIKETNLNGESIVFVAENLAKDHSVNTSSVKSLVTKETTENLFKTKLLLPSCSNNSVTATHVLLSDTQVTDKLSLPHQEPSLCIEHQNNLFNSAIHEDNLLRPSIDLSYLKQDSINNADKTESSRTLSDISIASENSQLCTDTPKAQNSVRNLVSLHDPSNLYSSQSYHSQNLALESTTSDHTGCYITSRTRIDTIQQNSQWVPDGQNVCKENIHEDYLGKQQNEPFSHLFNNCQPHVGAEVTGSTTLPLVLNPRINIDTNLSPSSSNTIDPPASLTYIGSQNVDLKSNSSNDDEPTTVTICDRPGAEVKLYSTTLNPCDSTSLTIIDKPNNNIQFTSNTLNTVVPVEQTDANKSTTNLQLSDIPVNLEHSLESADKHNNNLQLGFHTTNITLQLEPNSAGANNNEQLRSHHTKLSTCKQLGSNPPSKNLSSICLSLPNISDDLDPGPAQPNITDQEGGSDPVNEIHNSACARLPNFTDELGSITSEANLNEQERGSEVASSSLSSTCISLQNISDHLGSGNAKANINQELNLNHGSDSLNSACRSLPVFCCKICSIACPDLETFSGHSCRFLDDLSRDDEDASETPSNKSRVLITNVVKLHQVRRFSCCMCGVEFRALRRIVYHLSRCRPGPYTCNACSQLYNNRSELHYHMNKQHRREKCHVCAECGKAFQRRTSLEKHLIHWHEDATAQGPYRCDACPKKFIRRIYLTNHKLRMHQLDKKFLCQVCGNKFLSSASLSVHLKVVHSDRRSFACEVCDKSFKRKEKLMLHQRRHTGERPFSCDVCSCSFVSKSKLNEHSVRQHQPAHARRRYHCHLCDKSYANCADLRKHCRRVHDTEMTTPTFMTASFAPAPSVEDGRGSSSSGCVRTINTTTTETNAVLQRTAATVTDTGNSAEVTESVRADNAAVVAFGHDNDDNNSSDAVAEISNTTEARVDVGGPAVENANISVVINTAPVVAASIDTVAVVGTVSNSNDGSNAVVMRHGRTISKKSVRMTKNRSNTSRKGRRKTASDGSIIISNTNSECLISSSDGGSSRGDASSHPSDNNCTAPITLNLSSKQIESQSSKPMDHSSAGPPVPSRNLPPSTPQQHPSQTLPAYYHLLQQQQQHYQHPPPPPIQRHDLANQSSFITTLTNDSFILTATAVPSQSSAILSDGRHICVIPTTSSNLVLTPGNISTFANNITILSSNSSATNAVATTILMNPSQGSSIVPCYGNASNINTTFNVRNHSGINSSVTITHSGTDNNVLLPLTSINANYLTRQ